MSLFSKWFEGRQFKLALNFLMAKYTYDRLSEEQIKKVDECAISLMRMAGSQAPVLTLYALPEEQYFGVLALAMRRISLRPLVQNEKWRYSWSLSSNDELDERSIGRAVDYLIAKHGIDVFGNEDEEKEEQEQPSHYELASKIATTMETIVNDAKDEGTDLEEYYVLITNSYRVVITLEPKMALEPLKCAVKLGEIAKDDVRCLSLMDDPFLRRMAIDQLAKKILVNLRDDLYE